MFIVFTKDGKIYKEGADLGKDKKVVWDSIPNDAEISRIQLTYPFTVFLKGKGKVAPLLTIGKFDYYYFMNEGKVRMILNGQNFSNPQSYKPELEAKIVGGIDISSRQVMETRLDKLGNCTISRFPLKELEERIKAGTFRKEIIKCGVGSRPFE